MLVLTIVFVVSPLVHLSADCAIHIASSIQSGGRILFRCTLKRCTLTYLLVTIRP